MIVFASDDARVDFALELISTCVLNNGCPKGRLLASAARSGCNATQRNAYERRERAKRLAGRWSTIGPGLALALSAVFGCGKSTEQAVQQNIGTLGQALTADQERVLGFESPLADFSSQVGTLQASTNRTQGSKALSVAPNGWTEINSVPISSLGPVLDTVSYDVLIPADTPWASVHLILISAELEFWWQDLGYHDLSELTATGTYQTVSFPLSAEVKQKLESAYSDLVFKLVVNAPASAGPFLLDNLVITEPDLPPVPARSLCDFSVYSSEATDLRDRVVADGTVGSAQYIELGAPATVNGNVESGGNALLRNGATVNGTLTAAGEVSFSDPGNYSAPNLLEHTPVETQNIPERSVSYGTADVSLSNGQMLTLVPGSYNEVHAFSGSTLTLTSGVYDLRRFFMESSSVHLALDISGGPIQVNVEEELRFGDEQVMELVGGADPSLVQFYSNSSGQIKIGTDTQFFGLVTAPHAEIYAFSRVELHGGLYGRRVIVDTDSTVNRVPCGGTNSKTDCANTLADSAFGQSSTPQELQEAILRYCAGSDAGPCETALLAQLNVDYYLAARQVIQGVMSTSKHLAFMLDRERKTRQIHGNEPLACQILATDPDQDFVPSSTDSCPGTPLLTATLASGCTDPALPGAPPVSEVLSALPSLAIAIDPRCVGAPSPNVASPFGAWRFPSDPSVGKAVWLSRDLGDSSDCPKRYIVQAKLTDGTVQTVAFKPEEDVNLSWIQRGTDILQFNIHETDAAGRGAWADYDVFTDRYRVKVLNAAGRQSAWSNWYRPGQEGCAAGACPDF